MAISDSSVVPVCVVAFVDADDYRVRFLAHFDTSRVRLCGNLSETNSEALSGTNQNISQIDNGEVIQKNGLVR